MQAAAWSGRNGRTSVRGCIEYEAPVSPEIRLWTAILHRAVSDANGSRIFIDGKRVSTSAHPIDRRRARVWFQDRDTRCPGWLWVASVLDFEPSHVQFVERAVFANEPVHILSSEVIAKVLLQ